MGEKTRQTRIAGLPGANGSRRRGMTLVELLVSTALLVGGGGALLVGLHYSMLHADYLGSDQVAMNAVQGKLEELAATNFDTLLTGVTFQGARTAAGQCMGLGEDANCSGTLNGGEDVNGNGVLDEPLSGGRLNVRIWSSIAGAASPTLLDLHVSACWPTHGRTIGEDQNCNGQWDVGEDVNGNGLLDSPATASSRVARKD